MSARRHFPYFPRKIEFSFNSKITKMLFLFTNYALQNPSVQCFGFNVTFLAFFLLFNMKPNKLKYKKSRDLVHAGFFFFKKCHNANF